MRYSKADFLSRCDVRLDLMAGLTPSTDKAPSSELLILAVACRGTSTQEENDLVQSLEHRFCTLAADGNRLLRDGLDAVEAVNLLSEREVRPVHPFTREAGKKTKVQQCLTIHPLGRGYGVELAMEHGVHLGRQGGPDDDRRRTMFWTVYMLDAIRSLSARRMYRIQNEDIGWPPWGSESTFFSHAKAHASAAHASAKMIWTSKYMSLICSVNAVNAGSDDYQLTMAYERLNKSTQQACLQASQVAQQCITHDLVDSAPNILTNVPEAWGLWCARSIATSKVAPESGMRDGNNHFEDL